MFFTEMLSGLSLDLDTGYVWRQKSESLLGSQAAWKRLLERPMCVGRHLDRNDGLIFEKAEFQDGEAVLQ